jgi:hypothetical protein
MNWYIAKLVFNIDIDYGKNNSQFDEQWRLIAAMSLEEAYFKARALGKEEEGSFINTMQKHVKWEFIDVPEIQLQDLTDGHKVYSYTREAHEAEAYINFVRNKAMLFQKKSSRFI